METIDSDKFTMAGEKAFQDVLDFVTKSNLNFSIYQTPFSAQLSLKKSFVKKFYESSECKLEVVKNDVVNDVDETRFEKWPMRLTEVNIENMKLRETIEENNHLINKLENKYKVLETDLEGKLRDQKKKCNSEKGVEFFYLKM